MRLLIIEDDETLAQNLKKILELKGFTVDWLADADKARTRLMLYRDDYDLALLDLSLSGSGAMDGMELAKQVRAEGVMTPIIILTGYSDTKVKIELLNSGADDYVVKPFSSDELIARIHSVLRRPSSALPTVHAVGDLKINTAEHSVEAGGKPIALTLKEYSLFECFVRRPNQVLTRNELCNELWDFDSVTWSNVLDVHMKNLRKKLHGTCDTARFETVRGVGYRLVV